MDIAIKTDGTSINGCNTHHTLIMKMMFGVLLVEVQTIDLTSGQARKISVAE
jgi:hypothetical protein